VAHRMTQRAESDIALKVLNPRTVWTRRGAPLEREYAIANLLNHPPF